MKHQEIFTSKAAPIRQGLTLTKTEKIYEIGQTLGITRSNIVKTLQKKPWIQNCITMLVAAAVIVLCSALCVKANHYGGISTQDFDILSRLMYTTFGRFF
ncbi:MAG: hypothetical protein JW840_02185 [Candidatus Thermoplasmatota archaeon]|nr:hypothetical protein [Candidatus Thermoplasmatota archaeon]